MFETSNPNRVKKNEVFSQGTDDSKNLRCMYIGDYEYVNISSFAVLGIKLWLEENGDLTLFDMGGAMMAPQNVFDHCAQTLRRRKLKLGDF